MRLVILCEGDTEKAVLRGFLAPFCSAFTQIAIINARGAGRLRNEFKDLAERELKTDPQAIVFCLIDLLNAPFNFPKIVEQDARPFHAQYAYIKQYMEQRISEALRPRFFAFPVVMEIETWLLADAYALNPYLSPPRDQRYERPRNPEDVANPSEELKRLVKRWRQEDYVKTLHGIRLFKGASAQRVYDDHCPHFEAMINKLLELQGQTAPKLEQTFAPPDHQLFHQLAALQDELDRRWEQVDRIGDLSDPEIEAIESLEDQIRTITTKIMQLPDSRS